MSEVTDGNPELEKARLRVIARAARRALGPEIRAHASAAIAGRVLGLGEIASARAVLLYGASPEEVDTLAIELALRALGVRIAYPRVAGAHDLQLHWLDTRDELVEGSFGLLEPRPDARHARAAEIEAIVVPGVAFDEHGGRVGYGRGYYDTLLGGECSGVPSIGVAFDEQVFAQVPCEARDRRVSVLVTPTRTLRGATRRP